MKSTILIFLFQFFLWMVETAFITSIGGTMPSLFSLGWWGIAIVNTILGFIFKIFFDLLTD